MMVVLLIICLLMAQTMAQMPSATFTKPTIASITGCRGKLSYCQPELALTLTGPTFYRNGDIVLGSTECPFQVQMAVRQPDVDQRLYTCLNPQFGRLPLSLVCSLPKIDDSYIGFEFSVRVIDQSFAVRTVDAQYDQTSDWLPALTYNSTKPSITPEQATIEELETVNKSISHALLVWQIAAIVFAVMLMSIMLAAIIRLWCRKSAKKQHSQPLLSDVPFPRASNQVYKARTNPSPFAPRFAPLRRHPSKPRSIPRPAAQPTVVSQQIAPEIPLSRPVVRFYPASFEQPIPHNALQVV